MRTKISFFILWFLLFILALSFHLDIWSRPVSIQECVEKIISAHSIPWCNTAVLTNGRPKYESFSLSGDSLSPDSLYQAGAVTEILTSLALQKLETEGRISPDNTITDFYPWLTFLYEEQNVDITVGQLATHSSGIPFNTKSYLTGTDHEGMLRTNIRKISGTTLDFLPGTDRNVVEMNYSILAFIIEKVTGMSWSSYIKQAVLEPAGLLNTYLCKKDIPDDSLLIQGTRTFAGIILRHRVQINSINQSATGMITSSRDLIILAQHLLDNGIPANYSSFTTADGKTFCLNGEMENYSTFFQITPEENKAIIVQCSGMRAPADRIALNYEKQTEGKDDFLLSFISTETIDLVLTFLTIMLMFMAVNYLVQIYDPRHKFISRFRSTFGIIITLLFMAATALLPFLMKSNYIIVALKSPLMLLIFIGLSQLCGILHIIRNIALKKQKKPKFS